MRWSVLRQVSLYMVWFFCFFRNETNLMEAASAGAQSTIKLIAYVVVNLIAFLAILSFVDTIISFYGGRIGHPEVDFEVIILRLIFIYCHYVWNAINKGKTLVCLNVDITYIWLSCVLIFYNWPTFVIYSYLNPAASKVWRYTKGRGGSRGVRAPPKIGKNMIFWHKIVIFHTKYPKNFRTSLRNWKKYDFLA